MIIFNLMSLQFTADNDTINWKERTITIKNNIKLIHVTINQYPDQIYKSKKTNDIVYNWNKFLKYWTKHIPDYSKAFNIEFEKLSIGVDYSLAPINISTDDNVFIGIYIFNTTIIKYMKNNNSINIIIENQSKINKLVSYSFLSSIKPYTLSKIKLNNKYNCVYGILNNNDNLKDKEFILDTKINISLKYILQNSMNYLPKLEIKRY